MGFIALTQGFNSIGLSIVLLYYITKRIKKFNSLCCSCDMATGLTPRNNTPDIINNDDDVINQIIVDPLVENALNNMIENKLNTINNKQL
jgi:hypothetical protein